MNTKIYATLIILSAIFNIFADLGTQALALEPVQKVKETKEIKESKIFIEPSISNTLDSQQRDRISSYIDEPKQAIAEVTSVSQLSDVKATDWAFISLQSLVERYGCIAGYPNRTYQGKQAIARYEFAAGLNACLDKINEILSAGLADKVSQADLTTLKKLQEEFAAELSVLRSAKPALKISLILSKQAFSPAANS